MLPLVYKKVSFLIQYKQTEYIFYFYDKADLKKKKLEMLDIHSEIQPEFDMCEKEWQIQN